LSSSPDRRSFLEGIIKGSATLIAFATTLPAIGFLLRPIIAKPKKRKAKVIFKSPEDANSSTFVVARYEGLEDTAPGVFVKKGGDGAYVIISAACTHAGCSVDWKSEEKQFFCPCHQGKFDESGKNIAGPPPKPLERLTASLVDGQLYVEESEA